MSEWRELIEINLFFVIVFLIFIFIIVWKIADEFHLCIVCVESSRWRRTEEEEKPITFCRGYKCIQFLAHLSNNKNSSSWLAKSRWEVIPLHESAPALGYTCIKKPIYNKEVDKVFQPTKY